jgi:hypothetical protein
MEALRAIEGAGQLTDREAALCAAAKAGRLPIVQYLLSTGTSANAKTAYLGSLVSAVFEGTHGGHVEVLQVRGGRAPAVNK